MTVEPGTGKARGVAFLDAATGEPYEATARRGRPGGLDPRVGAAHAALEVPPHPDGIGNSSGHVGHNFCEHVMGPRSSGLVKDLVGQAPTLDDGRPGGFYIPRFRNLKDRQPGFLRGYGFEGARGSPDVPRPRPGHSRLRGRVQEVGAGVRTAPLISMGGFGEVLPRYENHVELDPEAKDEWGIPALRFHYKFGDNEKKMCEDMARRRAGDVRGGRDRDPGLDQPHPHRGLVDPRARHGADGHGPEDARS